MNFFVFTAAEKDAQKHFRDTVLNSVDVDILRKHLAPEDFNTLFGRSDGSGFYCWGSRPGRGILYWEKMEEGDRILTYWDLKIHHVARIILKVRNKQLARALWGESAEGELWEYMYFFSKPEIIDPPLPLSDTEEYLPKRFQGFTRIAEAKTKRILDEFGSLENFIATYSENHQNLRKAVVKNTMSNRQIIDHVHNYIKGTGFQYKTEEIANFYLALRTKPFVILAGVSGTGKTQLPRKFAAAIGLKENVIQVSVRPDWADGSDLLGYTSLDGNFIAKDLLLAIQKAKGDKKKPFFFILDEMNLARVEHYFSDFLSVIETREWDQNGEIITDPLLRHEMLTGARNRKEFEVLGWPDNLYLIGTVNMDETTHTFSRKVLDRANTIEMNSIDLLWGEDNNVRLEELSGIENDFLKTTYLHASELTADDKKSLTKDMGLLIEINNILKEGGLHFAYRVRDEIAFYLLNNKKDKLVDDSTAFDFQLMQKVLPRIEGSSERVQSILNKLLKKLENQKTEGENPKYPLSLEKIRFMLKRFDEDRITHFWP
ncbi:McrB family protein [Chitinophaga sp. CF418]|uniref:McrB family protein n=1 Tax=Chitinophaga sp. CF418 TaxID=1855287 RepID=UPI00091DCF03|nr:AAA family ATPase [Chitinophaga sp. CF418]SHM52493.1 AAA domain (dynein-related subfamily) [Chitinophaga sp. CF418]